VRQGTVNGLVSLGIDPTHGLSEGDRATFVMLRPPLGVSRLTFDESAIHETLATWIVQGGKQSGHVSVAYVDGERVFDRAA
jgi:hypothetical protein